jgi:hypothetical protein
MRRGVSIPNVHNPSHLYLGGHHLNIHFLLISSFQIWEMGHRHTIESTSKSPRDCTDETIKGGFEFILPRQLLAYELASDIPRWT